jgi:signal transduction histidine kinase
VWALIGSIALVIVCIALALSAAGNYSNANSTFAPAIRAIALVALFPMTVASILLVWRHRFPVLVLIITAGLALILPTTPLPALIALAAVAAMRRGWLLWLVVAGTYLATVVACLWDVASYTSLISDFIGGPPPGSAARVALFWVVPALAAMIVAPFAAFGIGRRVRAERDTAQRGNAAATRNIAALHQEVSLERERQELAREIHDTLAARLSAVSLNAGALELSVSEDNIQAVAAARAVRESAQTSLDDLRQVVRVLRNPTAAAPETHTGLSDLGDLVDTSLREGTDIRAQILVGDPASCHPGVAHVCYRLVQESVSNVRRHAPGATLYVDVRGGPETGLTIRTVNWLVPAASTSRGGGHGLIGMSERAANVGGTFQAGPTAEGSFALVAWLPWQRR